MLKNKYGSSKERVFLVRKISKFSFCFTLNKYPEIKKKAGIKKVTDHCTKVK